VVVSSWAMIRATPVKSTHTRIVVMIEFIIFCLSFFGLIPFGSACGSGAG
jgi:hypothetical protein